MAAFFSIPASFCFAVPVGSFMWIRLSRLTFSKKLSITPAATPVTMAWLSSSPRSFAATIASVAAAPPSVAEAAAGGTPSAASAAVAALSSMDVPTPYANAAASPWSYWRFFVTSPRTPLA